MATININEVLTDKTLTIEYKVKIAILYNYGYKNPDPASLNNKKALADFNFDGPAFIMLTRYFNLIAVTLNNGAIAMLPEDIQALNAVQDCIATVTSDVKTEGVK